MASSVIQLEGRHKHSVSVQMAAFITALRNKLATTSLVTYLLFCLFGVGSWIAVNGIWSELPILLITQPECLKLATTLTLIFQIANLGPLIYFGIKIFWHMRHLKVLYLEILSVFVIVIIGIVSSILLGIFWNHTVHIGSQATSIVFYTLAFCLGLVDCTSSVVFVPFMQHFPSQYLSALYIGEGLSGLLPSIVALVQGSVDNSLTCTQGHETRYSVSELGILFSPNVFFSLLAFVMVICVLAFMGILLYPVSRRELLKNRDPSESLNETDSTSSADSQRLKQEETILTSEEVRSPLLESETHISTEEDINMDKKMQPSTSKFRKIFLSKDSLSTQILFIIWNQRTPLFCLVILSFLLNGALPSVSSFAFSSYGNLILHLAINLGLLMNPLAAFLFMILPARSNMLIAMFTAVCCILGLYILINAFSYGVLVSGTAGAVIIVSSSFSIVTRTMCMQHYSLFAACKLLCNTIQQ